jgi:Glycosyltransferases involved in cell wall biogenesis
MHMTQTTSSPEISVVVPLFNEEESIAIFQTELSAALSGLDYEVVFVDDGSVDRTAERIETVPNIRLIRFEKNSGQSAAIYAGLTAARGGTVVIIDGDLQNDPADIPKLLAEIARGADLVCGYRIKRRDTVTKRLTSRIANAVRSRYTKDGVRDTGCTLKAMQRECVQCAVSIQGHASFHSRAGQSGRLSSGRNSGEPSSPSLRPKQVRPRQPRLARNHRYVRCTLVAVPAIELQDSREDVTDATHEQRGKSRLST